MRVHHVVAAVLVRGAAVLLGHRSPHRRRYPGVRDLPGGHVVPCEVERPLAVDAADLHLALRVVRAWHGEPRDLQPHEYDELRWGTAEARGPALAHPSHADLVARVTGALPD